MCSQSVSVNSALIQDASVFTTCGGRCNDEEPEDVAEKAKRLEMEKRNQEELEERFNRGLIDCLIAYNSSNRNAVFHVVWWSS